MNTVIIKYDYSHEVKSKSPVAYQLDIKKLVTFYVHRKLKRKYHSKPGTFLV